MILPRTPPSVSILEETTTCALAVPKAVRAKDTNAAANTDDDLMAPSLCQSELGVNVANFMKVASMCNVFGKRLHLRAFHGCQSIISRTFPPSFWKALWRQENTIICWSRA